MKRIKTLTRPERLPAKAFAPLPECSDPECSEDCPLKQEIRETKRQFINYT